jgi:hypothetical protein
LYGDRLQRDDRWLLSFRARTRGESIVALLHPILRSLGVFGPLIAAVIRRADRRIQEELRHGQATSPDRAVTLAQRSPIGRWRLSRLMRAGVVRTVATDRYYWEESAWPLYRRARRRRALSVLSLLLIAIAILWWQGIVR